MHTCVSPSQGQREEERARKDPLRYYLSDVFLLLFFEGQFDEDLLQLLIAVVDDELLKAVVLSDKTGLRLLLCKRPLLTTPSSFAT